jgi:hypothetical protein
MTWINKRIELLTSKIFILLTITTFVNIVMVLAANFYIGPIIKYTFNYVLNNLTNERKARLIFELFGKEDRINELVVVVCFVLNSFLVTFAYVFSITVISALLALMSIKKLIIKFLSLMNFSFKSEATLIDEINLIVKWVALYSILNLATQAFCFSDFIYYKLAVLFQGIIFYLLLNNNSFNYRIKKINDTTKYLS